MFQLLKKVFFNEQFRKIGIYGFGQFFNLAAPFLVIPHLIDVCGTSNFGKSSVALAIMFFLIVFIDYGSDILGVKNVSINRNNFLEIKKIFCTTFLARFLILIVVLSAGFIIVLTVPYFKVDYKLYIFSFAILIGHFLNPIWFFQGIENYNWISYLNIFSKAIYIIAVYFLIKQTDDFILINLFIGIGMIVAFSFGIIKIVKDYKVKWVDFCLNDTILFLKRDFTFCISQMFISIKNYFPILFVSYFGGFNSAAYYKIIEQIILPIRTYLQIFFRFFYPKLSYKIHNNPKEGFRFWKIISLFNAVLIAGLLIVIFFSSGIILKFFKIDLQLIPKVEQLLKWFLLFPVFFFISFILEFLYLVIGERKHYIRYIIYSVVFCLITMFILVQYFDIYGILSALVLSELLLVILYFIKLKKLFKKTIHNEA